MWLAKIIGKLSLFKKKALRLFHADGKKKKVLYYYFRVELIQWCAASEFIKDKKEVVLVSHNSHGNQVVDESQNNVHDILEKHYKTEVRHIHIKVYGRNRKV